jgi:exodeoxyribonuclease V beta subunit
MKILDNVADISIDKHGLIEASAGTGKTYTIEHLAIRMIKEKKITLDKILIVTFTEKATGELRQRLRAKLLEECSNEKTPEILDLLHHSLDYFDQTSIFTMHSFCHTILKDFSFEMAENFQPIIANNKEIYRDILEKEIRKKWPVVFGDKLLSVLNLFKFEEEAFVNSVINICGLMRMHPQFSLSPLPKDISVTLFQGIEDCIKNILALSPSINLGEFQGGQPSSLSEVLKGKSVDYFNDKILQLLTWHQNKNFLLKKIKFAPFSALKNQKDMASFDLVKKIYEQLDKINDLENESYFEFINWNVAEVLNASETHKKENNLIAYDDMILKTEAMLSNAPEKNSILQKIRLKYQYGMIDEFQDTDLFQWSIFKSIFIDSPSSFLFLIGDPKQSIYRFRNADIHTYLEAKNLIEKLKVENKGDLYSLRTNFRSFAPLIDDFNFCFKASSWFGMPNENFNIEYIESKPSSKESKYKHLQSIPSPGFKLIEITETNKPEFFKEYSQNIVQEIIRLKKNPNVNYGDFCCLYDVKANMAFMIAELQKYNIPYSVYQEEGISESMESKEVSYLLNAIFSPNNEGKRSLALITSFFQISPKDLPLFRELESSHEILRKLLHWQSLGQNRHWAKMFQSIFEETGIIAYCLTLPEGDRKIANFKQIMEWLEFKAYEDKLSLWDLCSLISEYKSSSNSLTDDEKKMRLHSESKKVQLMTIHVSKGLEFPFVFFCKYSASNRSNKYPFWIRKNNQYLIVADPESIQYLDDFTKEQFEEQKRLMYVTFTRAIHSLYMPYCPESKDNDFKSIAQDFIQTNKNRFEFIKNDLATPNMKKVDANEKSAETDAIVNWNYEEIPRHRLYDHMSINSYSHLSEKGKKLIQTNIDKSDARFDDDEGQEAIAEVFPKGPNTGNFFHALFENISFSDVEALWNKKADYNCLLEDRAISQFIDESMKTYLIENKWKESVCKVLFDSLTKNIFPFDNEFHLSKLTSNQRIHELEFYYPTTKNKTVVDTSAFMKGFIDLIFEWQGKYYILDWKSNYIENGYEMPALENAMLEHQYDLQYSVYSVCLFRWLKARGMKDSEWLSKFGGIIYLFIRGTTESKGCYFKSSEKLPSIEDCLKRINHLMGQIG